MKRPVVFLLLGPSLVALAVWMVAAAIAGRIDDSFIGVCAITAFLLTLPVSSIAGLMDGYLARGLPTLLRASLTAAFGMTIAIGLILRPVRDHLLTDGAAGGHEWRTLRGLLPAAADGRVLAVVE